MNQMNFVLSVVLWQKKLRTNLYFLKQFKIGKTL